MTDEDPWEAARRTTFARYGVLQEAPPDSSQPAGPWSTGQIPYNQQPSTSTGWARFMLPLSAPEVYVPEAADPPRRWSPSGLEFTAMSTTIQPPYYGRVGAFASPLSFRMQPAFRPGVRRAEAWPHIPTEREMLGYEEIGYDPQPVRQQEAFGPIVRRWVAHPEGLPEIKPLAAPPELLELAPASGRFKGNEGAVRINQIQGRLDYALDLVNQVIGLKDSTEGRMFVLQHPNVVQIYEQWQTLGARTQYNFKITDTRLSLQRRLNYMRTNNYQHRKSIEKLACEVENFILELQYLLECYQIIETNLDQITPVTGR